MTSSLLPWIASLGCIVAVVAGFCIGLCDFGRDIDQRDKQ